MGKLSMCRICVAENVRMHVVTDENLHDVYEKLTDVPFVSEDRRPMVACYLCYVKLKQCYRLMKQCVQAEEVFTRMSSENQEEIKITKRQDEKYFSELTVAEVTHVSIDNEVWPIDSIKQECMEQELDMCETQDDGEQTKEDNNVNAFVVNREDDSQSDQEYLVPVREEECSLDDEPLMFFKSEEEEVEDVCEEEQRAATEGMPVANKPKLYMQGATLRDTNTDKQTTHGISEPETCHSNENCTHESLPELNKSTIHDSIKTKRKKITSTEIIDEVNTGVDNNRCNDISKGSNRDGITGHHSSCSEQKHFTCDICQITLNYKCQLIIHLRIHNHGKPYECDTCQKRFARSSHLKRHSRIHTGEKPYKCVMCQRGFGQRNSLKSHVRTHTGEKPYKCEMCQRGFTQRSYLNSHVRKHTGDKPYECEICQRRFTQRNHLENHVRTHTGDKPYKCEICQRGFTRRSSLESHFRIHTGEKPYQCKICQRRFTVRRNLESHVHTHTGDKPYKCEICQRGFTRRSHLNSHIRTHTGKTSHN